MTHRVPELAEVEQRLTEAFRAKARLLAARDAVVAHLAPDMPEATRVVPPEARIRSTRARLLPVAAAAMIALASGGYWLVAHHTSRGVGDQHRTSSSNLDAVTEGRLWDLAARVARQDGAAIQGVQAVKTTAATALRVLLNATDSGTSAQPVWAVQIEAASPFHCEACPAGVPTRAARYILLIVNPTTFESSGGGIQSNDADLAQLGTVVTVHDTGVIASSPPQSFGVHIRLTNLSKHSAQVFGCPQCLPPGLAIAPGMTMLWTERRQSNVSYRIQAAGHRSRCPTPMKPERGSAQAENYTITPDGRCQI